MPKPRNGPDVGELKRVLHYDPETGIFTRLIRSGNGHPGPVGTKRPDGYLQVCVGGKTYLLHRLAVQYMTGEWPTLEVDHINGDKHDNRWRNLRVVDHRTNTENWRKPRPSRKYGSLLGAHKNKNRWRAMITVNHQVIVIGSYETEREAHEAYLKVKRQLHAGCTI